MKNTVFFLAFLFLLSAFATVSAQEKFTLKNQYPEGEYEMIVGTNMDMTIEMAGQKIPMIQAQKLYYRVVSKAPNPDDGAREVGMELTRMAMKQESMGTNAEFDSGDESKQSPMLKQLGAMVGMKMTMTFDKDGKVTRVSGLDEFWAKLEKTPGFAKPMLDMLKQQMTEEKLTAIFDAQRAAMPQQPVAVGDNWKAKSSSVMPMIGKVDAETDNTLKSVETVDGVRYAEILSKSEIDSTEPNEMDMGIAKMDFVKTKMEVENTIRMEIETGLVVSTVSSTKMEIDAEMKMGDRKMEQKLTGDGKTTVTVTRVKK